MMLSKILSNRNNKYRNRLLKKKAIQNEAEELTDPRGEGSWGFKAVAKELQSALTGGVQDTATSVATFAERTADALSGEMQEGVKKKGTTNQSGIRSNLTLILLLQRHGGVKC